MIKELIKLATHLDNKGRIKEADYLDSIIRVAAEGAAGEFLYKITARNNDGVNLLGPPLGYKEESEAFFFTSKDELEGTLLDIIYYLEKHEPEVLADHGPLAEMSRVFMENHMNMHGFEYTPNIITKEINMSMIQDIILK